MEPANKSNKKQLQNHNQVSLHMPLAPRAVLVEYFQSGDKPTASQFGILIDSTVNIVDDRDLIGLREYNPAFEYLPGDCSVHNNQVVQCISTTTGTYDPNKWTILAAFGSVTYAGTWDAENNVPALTSSVGTQGFYYVVSNANANPSLNHTLNGINDWAITDWAIFNGNIWEKVDNSQAPVDAQDVAFEPTPSISSLNVQDAIEEVYAELITDVNTKVSISGDTMTGSLILNADPTLPLGAATKAFVESGDSALQTAINAKVNREGDTMLGDLVLNQDPTLSLGASTKQYVDSEIDAQQLLINEKVNRTGDTMTGDLILNAPPSVSLGAATKGYVDSGLNSKLDLSGGTLTGNLILNTDPTLALGAVTKQYADGIANAKLSLTGGTLTGPLILNANPAAALGAATKQYVDAAVGAVPPQQKILVIPFSFATVYNFPNGSSTTWSRVPVQALVPNPNDIFPRTTLISARINIDYTSNALGAGIKMGLLNFTDYLGGTIANANVLAGSSSSLTTLSGLFNTVVGPSFTLPGGKSWSVVIQRTAGTVSVEAASLILTFS